MAFGFFWGTWAVAALDVQRYYGFSDAQLGLLLAATVFGGAAANASGGVLAERHGTRFMLTLALVLWGATLALTAAASATAPFCVLFLLTVATGGLVDVVMNVAGTAALGAHPPRLLRLNAQYNAGALVGALCAGVLLDVDVSFRAVWAGIAATALLLALWCSRAALPAAEAGEHHTLRAGVQALTHGGLRALAVVFSIGALVEGGIGTWGVLFLRSRLGLAIVAGAGAFAVGAALATFARCTLGWTAARLGGRRAAQLGLGAASIGLLVEATSRSAAVAAVGLAVAAMGVSVYWPLLLAYASDGTDRPGVVVGGLSACGYVGFLAGPPVVGWISQATSLRWGVATLAGAALVGATIRLHAAAPARAPR